MSGDHNMNQTYSGWRKRQIALEKMAENARELGLAPATQDVDRFCDANCTWSDHHPDCKLAQPAQEPVKWADHELDGMHHNKPEERNFCSRCGKRAGDYIHTCTPPQD
jgi:hypothetical protein